MHLQKIYTKFKNSNKLAFLVRTSCYLFYLLTCASLPLFTYRAGYNVIPIIFAAIFIVQVFVYCIFFKKFLINYFVICLSLFTIYCFTLTALTTRDFDPCKSIFTVSVLAIAIFEFFATEKKLVFAFSCVLLSSIVLSASILIENFESIISLDFGRLGSTYGDLNTVGLIIVSGSLSSLWLSSEIEKKYIVKKILLICLALILLVFVLLTGSRGAFITGILIFALYLFFILFGYNKKLFFIILICLIVGFAFLIQIPVFKDFKDRLFQMIVTFLSGGQISGEYSTDNRTKMFQEGMQIWTMNPIFGNGGSAFAIMSNQHTWAHSTIPDLLSAFGIIGAGLWFFPLIRSLSFGQKTKTLSIIFAVGYILPSLFHSVIYYDKFTMILYALFCCNYFIKIGREKNCLISIWYSKNKGLRLLASNSFFA